MSALSVCVYAPLWANDDDEENNDQGIWSHDFF